MSKTRTTLTLDEDVARELKARARQEDRPYRDVVNDALRRGLMIGEKPVPYGKFQVPTFSSAFQPGIDPGRLNHLIDELETEDQQRSLTRSPDGSSETDS
ncbi:MAG: antitoxin [Acidobacteriota bacterium]